jgi:hypothetical protein
LSGVLLQDAAANPRQSVSKPTSSVEHLLLITYAATDRGAF